MNKVSSFSYTRSAPKGVGGFGGEGNYWVPVSSHFASISVSLFLFLPRFMSLREITHPFWFFGFLILEVHERFFFLIFFFGVADVIDSSKGGFHPDPDSKTAVPDWVDSTVADWIKFEVLKMDDVWGPATFREAVAFVHIPP